MCVHGSGARVSSVKWRMLSPVSPECQNRARGWGVLCTLLNYTITWLQGEAGPLIGNVLSGQCWLDTRPCRSLCSSCVTNMVFCPTKVHVHSPRPFIHAEEIGGFLAA